VLVYSPISPISYAEFKKRITKGDAPILIDSYASANAVITDRVSDDFHLRWREDGLAVAVIYRDEVIAVSEPEDKYGCSKAIAHSGSFGDPLLIEKYTWLL
jgi:hypothetical protein